jgi:hypothetical protein
MWDCPLETIIMTWPFFINIVVYAVKLASTTHPLLSNWA